MDSGAGREEEGNLSSFPGDGRGELTQGEDGGHDPDLGREADRGHVSTDKTAVGRIRGREIILSDYTREDGLNPSLFYGIMPSRHPS